MSLNRLTAAILTSIALAAQTVDAQSATPQSQSPAKNAQRVTTDWVHGPFMEIFVRAYADSNGDGIGDFKGLTSKLDYIQSLGIRGIWLMPITKSSDRDHGYATTDFLEIEPDYGTLADFDTFIKAAHERGIGVIADYVLNHASQAHPFFVQSRENEKSPYRDWFVWRNDTPQDWDIWGKSPWYWIDQSNTTKPWMIGGHPSNVPPAPLSCVYGGDNCTSYFGTFGQHMPDFNMRNAKVVTYHENALKTWLDRGLDGFRLDATPHLVENDGLNWNDQPESRAMTKRFVDGIHSYKAADSTRRYVVCEATSKPEEWATPEVCRSSFAFGLQYTIMDAARGKKVDSKDPKDQPIAKLIDYVKMMPNSMGTFLHNHDIFAGRRVADQVKGDTAAYKLAAATYLLAPGIPFVYYGEEIGMAGTPCTDRDEPKRNDKGELECGDFPLRGPMSWTSDAAGFTTGKSFRLPSANVSTNNVTAQLDEPTSLLHFYRALIKLRNSRASLQQGKVVDITASNDVVSFSREHEGQRTYVWINYSDKSVTEKMPMHTVNVLINGGAAGVGAAELRGPELILGPRSVAVVARRLIAKQK
jgi:alpha-amylase